MRSLIVSILLLLLAAPAHAQTGNEMLPSCKSFVERQTSPFTFSEGLCAGAVTALAYAGVQMMTPLRSCFPDKVTNQQLVRVVIAYMEANPAQLHNDYRELIVEALRKTWPCK